MPARAGDVAVADRLVQRDERLDDLARLLRREEPVAAEADDEPAASAAGEVRRQFLRRGAQVEEVHRERELDVAVRVEALDEFIPLIGQVRTDREALLELGRDVARPEAVGIELVLHRLWGEVGDVAEHARERQADGRAGLAVMLPAVEIGVAQDGVPADHVEGERLRAEAGGGGQGDRGFDAVGKARGPFEGLVAAGGAADDRAELLDAQPLDQPALDLGDVARRNRGEVGAVRLAGLPIEAVRAGGAAAAAEGIRADDEVLASVNGLFRARRRSPTSRDRRRRYAARRASRR